MKKRFYFTLIMVVSGLFLLGNAYAAKPMVLKLNNMFPATHIVAKHYLDHVPKILEKKSGGRLKLEVYYSDSLFASRDSFKYLRSGLFSMGFDWPTYHPDETPDLVYACDWPGNSNIKLWNKWFHAPKDSYGALVGPLYEAYGLKVLSFLPQVGTWKIWSRKPVKGLADMKGFLARRMGYGTVDTLFSSLGLSTVQLSIFELYEALHRGTVDVICTPQETFHAFKLHEVAKHSLVPPFANSNSSFVMRLDAFNSLPKDLQKALLDSFLEGQEMWVKAYWDLAIENVQKLEAKGVIFNTLSAEDNKTINGFMKKYTDAAAKRFPWAAAFRAASEKYNVTGQ
jgi:TRAP-type C4-dicarboxylate transport system substrate-binding protein